MGSTNRRPMHLAVRAFQLSKLPNIVGTALVFYNNSLRWVVYRMFYRA